MIFDAILHDCAIRSVLKDKKTIRILDFGCGTGGELLGFLHALENRMSVNHSIEIIGIDGNHNALRLLEKIISRYNSRGRNRVELVVAPCFIESQSDLLDISGFVGPDFDFIITSKAIGEFEKKRRIKGNCYEFFVRLFAPLLTETGIMSVIDVTTKDEHSGMFLPQRMNIGINSFLSDNKNVFKSLAPCSGLSPFGGCKHRCFYKKDAYISHSAKTKDHSKFTVRLISRIGLRLDEVGLKEKFHHPECILN